MSAKEKRGLGTGLDILFGTADFDEDEGELQTLPIMKIEPRKDQPREVFDEQALRELAESIGRYGLIQPIVVRKLTSGYYQIIAGERRWRASRMAGLVEVPVRVIEADDRRTAELALVENLQRENLNPIEEAKGYKTLMDEYDLTQDETAKRVGKSRPVIANAIRLLSLPQEIVKMLESGELTAGAARAILSIDDKDAQIAAAKNIVEKGMSVRQAETLAKSDSTKKSKTKNKKDMYIRKVERDLESHLGRKVSISGDGKKGKIEIEYYDADDFEKLCDIINNADIK